MWFFMENELLLLFKGSSCMISVWGLGCGVKVGLLWNFV